MYEYECSRVLIKKEVEKVELFEIIYVDYMRDETDLQSIHGHLSKT